MLISVFLIRDSMTSIARIINFALIVLCIVGCNRTYDVLYVPQDELEHNYLQHTEEIWAAAKYTSQVVGDNKGIQLIVNGSKITEFYIYDVIWLGTKNPNKKDFDRLFKFSNLTMENINEIVQLLKDANCNSVELVNGLINYCKVLYKANDECGYYYRLYWNPLSPSELEDILASDPVCIPYSDSVLFEFNPLQGGGDAVYPENEESLIQYMALNRQANKQDRIKEREKRIESWKKEYTKKAISCKWNDSMVSGSLDGHWYVDLGLSVKWASNNVGDNEPYELGGLFAWGELEEKDIYLWDTYMWWNGTNTTISKYCTESPFRVYGETDDKIELDSEDDCASVNWGDQWRMPTFKEWSELINNCSWTWAKMKGVYGYQVKSLVEGFEDKYIFLPAAESTGYMGHKPSHRYYDPLVAEGNYWSSSLYTEQPELAKALRFDRNGSAINPEYRSQGLSIRPVIDR
ncbi:MAG: hypothetical protein MJY88_09805 [Bacteroidales bacterium]|nr:hypothetical protein [Bacteroidales bacterium]